jgi:peptidoglycan/xylan/chitin deacetylase (PgdA/CDA1 family)
MDHNRYDFSPIITRDRLTWPNEARLAVWVILNIEHFHFDKLGTASRPVPWLPDVQNHSWRDYGLRFGIWRMMEALDRHGMRASVTLNAEVCDHYPIVVEEGMKRGWEYMGHALTNSQYLANLEEDEERRIIRETIAKIKNFTGAAPKGWLGPGVAETYRTPDILAEEGIEYVGDWFHDEQPYPMRVKSGRMISVPYTMELNDIPVFMGQNRTPEQFLGMITEQFDTLYEEGAENGRVMAIALHPFLSGVPYRIKYFDAALDYICRHKDVWLTTGGEIADYYYKNYYKAPK